MKPHVEILLFGGAFDPPHLGHLTVVAEILEAGLADQVELIPVGEHPFNKIMTSAHLRLKLTKLAFAKLIKKYPTKVIINEFELKSKQISYSYETALDCTKRNPGINIGFLIGSDNLIHFKDWKYGRELLDLVSLFVYPRPGFSKKKLQNYLEPKMHWLDEVTLVDCSSTLVRDLLKKQQPIPSGWLEPSVLEFIQKNLLIQYQH
jgi:nicotinate-nucleotide adenylyltransferase